MRASLMSFRIYKFLPLFAIALGVTAQLASARTAIWTGTNERPIWQDAHNWVDGIPPESGSDSVLFDQVTPEGIVSNDYNPQLRTDFVLAAGQSMRSTDNTQGVLRLGEDVTLTIAKGAALDFSAGQFSLAEGGKTARLMIEAGATVRLHAFFNGNNIDHTTHFIADHNGVTTVKVESATYIIGGTLQVDLEHYDLSQGSDLVLFIHSEYPQLSTGFAQIKLSKGWSGEIDYHYQTASGKKGIALTNLKKPDSSVSIPESSHYGLLLAVFTLCATLSRRTRRTSHKRAMSS